ncbi:MAG TPA: acyl-CoA dehydrogenase family protein [Streptosporangiaceae bacterium]|nr:acyl-CoA dehydrogenase family protein [Streptosporangiaceae bacterium]
MDFEFSPEQRALAERIRAFAAERLAPAAGEGERRGRPRPGLFAELTAEGLFALRVPVAYGGQGAGAVSTGIVLEELAAGDLTAGYPVLNAALVADALDANATDEQRARWLPPIARGEAILTVGRTESGDGDGGGDDDNAAGIGLRATPAGDGWRLSGEQTSAAPGGHATHALVFARTGEADAPGVTAFFVSLDHPRVGRAGGPATLTFDDVRVGPDDVIGAPGRGAVRVLRGFDHSPALIALMCLGAAGAALDEALAYARRRHAFGEPIGRFQGVAFPLVEHATLLHAARLLAYEALWRKDAGLDHRTEANMVKWWAPRAAVDAAHQALLTLGHLGRPEDGPQSRRLRDVIGAELADGTANATKLVVARQLLGGDHAPSGI